jgi:hypothetical protein
MPNRFPALGLLGWLLPAPAGFISSRDEFLSGLTASVPLDFDHIIGAAAPASVARRAVRWA